MDISKLNLENVKLQPIKKNHKGLAYMVILGIDTETYKGKPISFQIAGDDFCDIIFCNENNITEKFLNYIFFKCNSKNQNYALFFYNINFDMPILFYKYKEKFLEDDVCIKIKDIKITGFFGKPSYFTISKSNLYIKCFDIYFYFPFSLGKVASVFGLEKLERLKGLGKYKYTEKNKKFVEYAKKDAEITQKIGRKIYEFHNEYDISMAISISQLAEKIFRHKFLKKDIPALPYEILKPSLRAYHGGKNGFYVKPGWYKKVYSYDIVSAYPYAMANLPDFENGDYYKVNEYKKGFVGVYNVEGFIKKCKYPIIYDDKGNLLSNCYVKDIWITSYELENALKWKEFKLKRCFGYVFISNSKEKTALQRFVETFFKLKNEEKNNEKRLFYKLILNSLYGKFIQMRKSSEIYDVENEKFLFKNVVTGKMFNPFIASLITGFVRAYIHDLEHKFNSIHTSTDSIKTLKPIAEKYLGSNLGDLKLEVCGKCLLLRNKLYLHYNTDGKLEKYALHGFFGSPDDLLKIWKTKNFSYEAEKMLLLKESIRQKKQPFVMERKTYELNINI